MTTCMSESTPSWSTLKGLQVGGGSDAGCKVEEVLSHMETFVNHVKDVVIRSNGSSTNESALNGDIRFESATAQALMKHISDFKQYSNHLFKHLNAQLGKCWRDCNSVRGQNCLEKATRSSRDLFCTLCVIRSRLLEFLKILSRTSDQTEATASMQFENDNSKMNWIKIIRYEMKKTIQCYVNTSIPTSILRVSSALKSCFKMYISTVRQHCGFHECWSHEDTQKLLNTEYEYIQGRNESKEDLDLLYRILISCLVSAHLECTLFDKVPQLQSGTNRCKEIMKIDEQTVNYDMLSILRVLSNNGKFNMNESILIDKRPMYKADLMLKAIVADMSQLSQIEQSMMKSLLSFDIRKELFKEKERRENPSGGRCFPTGFLGMGLRGDSKKTERSANSRKVEVALPSYTLPLNSSRSLEVGTVYKNDEDRNNHIQQQDSEEILKRRMDHNGNRKNRRGTF